MVVGKVPNSIFVQKLAHVGGIGVWQDHKPASPDCDFARKSIVYGFNGTGKTILARVFSSLESARLADSLGPQPTFQVTFSDGTVATETSLTHPLGNHLLVFNSDFIERNFKWAEGAASPIFHIDEENIEKVAELRKLETDLETAAADARAAKIRESEIQKSFKAKGTEIGGRVREAWGNTGYTQRFDRGNVEREYSEQEFTETDRLTDEIIDQFREIIRQPEPRPKLNLQIELPSDFQDNVMAAASLIAQTFAVQLTTDLDAHPTMLAWVGEGHRYHEESALGTCLYCNNEISEKRRSDLTALFSERWATRTRALSIAIDGCERMRSTLRGFLESLPTRPSIQPSQVAAFDEAEGVFRKMILVAGTAIRQLHDSLMERQQDPMKSISVPEGILGLSRPEWIASYSNALENLFRIITEHNQIHDQFQERKEAAAGAIKRHVLFGEQDVYCELKQKASSEEETAQRLSVKVTALQEKVQTLRNAIRKHGIAANELNSLLHEYLGHSSIRLEARDEGYQLVRADGSIAQNLSEGEKTALTFCFFLTQFGAEGRDRNKLVVVIDDPVSSLDSNAQTYAFGLIKKHTKRVAQVILLTHNLKLMHMAKRAFFRDVNFSDAVPTGLLFVDCRDTGSGSRRSSLVRMPTHLSKYDSEYQYLFSIVNDAAEQKSSAYLYLLPNAIRKLLEIFTAFAAPDKGSFAEALFDDSAKIKGLDQAEMNQLERVCQIESHGDIEAVNSLPALTIEESHRAATAAMKYIHARDNKHYDAMKRIVASGTVNPKS